MSSSPIATSSSGVDSAMRSMSAAAHDLAKASARDGRSARVDQAESKGGDAKSKAKPEDRPPAHVDEKLVELMRAKHAAKANLKAIKMEERMVGKLVDKHA